MKKVNVLVNKYVTPEYIEFLKEKFEVNVVDYDDYRNGNFNGSDIDLVLFAGGADVTPDLYNERQGKYTSTDRYRDDLDRRMYNDTEYLKALRVGICRGSQFLTVMAGGSLVQHVTGHGRPHTVNAVGLGSTTIKVTSTHHQMMFPFELPQDKYELLAWSTFFQSDTYLNGRNDEKDLPKDFLEPEIVYYNSTHAFAVQGHPEFREASREFKDYVLDHIDHYINVGRKR